MLSIDDFSKRDHIIHLSLGLTFLAVGLIGIFSTFRSGGLGGIITLLLFLPFPALAVLFLHPYILEPIVSRFCALMWPGGKNLKIRREFSSVRSLISSHEYPKAVDCLQQIIEENPDWHDARLLLANVFLDHLDDPESALRIAQAGLERAACYDEDQQRLLLTAVDCLMEMGDKRGAISFLEQRIHKVPRVDSKKFHDRLSGLKS